MQGDTNGIYVVSKETGAGSMLLAMGLMEMLKHRYGKVALFRPVFDEGKDGDIETLLGYFSLGQDFAETRGISLKNAERTLAGEGLSSLLEVIVSKYKILFDSYDFVLCIGSDLESLNAILGFDLNIVLAKNFSAPVAGIFSMEGKSEEDLSEILTLWSRSILKEGADIFLLCANRCTGSCNWKEKAASRSEDLSVPVCCIPKCDDLERLTIADIMEHLPVKWLAGNEMHRERNIHSFILGTMDLRSLLESIKEYEFVITSSSREDLVCGILLSAQSINTAPGSGVLLCGAMPGEKIMKLIAGLRESPVPILHTDMYERELIAAATGIKASIRLDNRKKIDTALTLFSDSIDKDFLKKQLKNVKHDTVTPTMFRLDLFERARKIPVTIVMPETEDDRILKAADIILRKKVAKLILVGRREDILRRSRIIGADLQKAEMVDHGREDMVEKYSHIYRDLRKHKGMTLERAREMVLDKNVFSTLLIREGRAEGMVSGAIHSTRDTILPALQIIKTKAGSHIASSCFFMCLPDRVLVYADCAVNNDPEAEDLAVIAAQTAETAYKFGVDPKVAMLSYSTGSSGRGEDVEKVRKATEILKATMPDLPVVGPIQYDAAIDRRVARIKMPDSEVAGRATVFIFPDLDTGNIAYKAVQRSAGAIAVGPVMQGLARPVNDLSRGCSVDDIVDTVAITAVQAQEFRQ